MREELDSLVVELKKLKQQGVSSILMERDTLELLQQEATKRPTASSDHLDPIVASPTSPISKQTEPPPTTTPPISTGITRSTELKKQTQEKVRQDFHVLPEVSIPPGSKEDQWKWLQKRVFECPVCNNHVKKGKKVVFGAGSIDADIFFCGEAPGADEEVNGLPFVGQAGQLLERIIQAMGLTRDTVYISNIMNWRPETETPYGNRPPTEDEMKFCLPYLKAQLDIVKPKVIVALGATAVNGLLGYDTKRSITRSHGEWDEFQSIPTIISFHPSYILRNGTNKVKRMIWEDMLSVMRHLKMPISDRQQGFFK